MHSNISSHLLLFLNGRRLGVLSLLFWSYLTFAEDNRPNIVFLLTDDQNLYSMGCYGTPDVKTPNLDQLASDCLLYTSDAADE